MTLKEIIKQIAERINDTNKDLNFHKIEYEKYKNSNLEKEYANDMRIEMNAYNRELRELEWCKELLIAYEKEVK